MSRIQSFEELVAYVQTHYPVNAQSHPGLFEVIPSPFSGLNLEMDERVATVRHGLVHMNKRMGNIASVIHDHDHGGEVDLSQLRVETAKFMVELIKLAESAGMTTEDIYRMVPEVMSSGK